MGGETGAQAREAAAQNQVLRAFSRVRFRANRTLSRHRRTTESDPGADFLARPAGNRRSQGLSFGEDDRARAIGLDHLTSRRQQPVRLVDPERNDRVGVLLTAIALVGVSRIVDFG
jgi:hypothetical protein